MTTADKQADVLGVLRDIRTQLEALNEKLATSGDSRSSAQIESNSNGHNLTVKVYAGSDIAEPVCAAVQAYGALYREVQAQSLNGWAETVEQLEAAKDAA